MASGKGAAGDDTISLTAKRGQTDYGICSNDFLEQAFRTDAYRVDITFNPDGSWSYVLQTTLMVHGRSDPFVHHDQNTLHKIADPKPNPLAQILAARKAKENRPSS